MLGRALKILIEVAIGLIIILLIAGYFLSIPAEKWKFLESLPMHQRIGYLVGDFLKYIFDFIKSIWEGFT